MEPVAIVSDTGPIVALAKVDHLGLLHTLFGTVLITEQVRNELLAKHNAESKRIENALAQGYWLSDQMLSIAAKLADETDSSHPPSKN